MRREFILSVLGIISVSTISSLLSNYAQVEVDKLLLDSVVGVVGAGNFSYWQLGHAGPLLIELSSLTGDADLYVADNVRPSYEIDRYNFSSATCGIDIVSIPADFPRPIGIGVFGAWTHSVSEYSIQVFRDGAKLLAMATDFHHDNADRTDNSERTEKPVQKKVDDEKPRFFLRLLNLLEMVFEMVVL